MLGVEGSLSLADMAYMETQGPPVRKVKAAIWAYIWSSQNGSEKFGMKFYPTLNEMREAMADAIRKGEL